MVESFQVPNAPHLAVKGNDARAIETSHRKQVSNDRYMIAKASYDLIVNCEA